MELGTSVNGLRPFLPAKDFSVSREFYRLLGFQERWASDQLAMMELGRCSFFLQNYFVKAHAENTVMALDVADVDACWKSLERLALPARFPTVVRLGAPYDDVPSGVRRGHFVDPSGVLWHFSQPLA